MSKQCAAIFYPRVLTARFLPRTAYLGGADVRQVGQVRQVGHQTAAPVRLSCRCGHTALVHNRSGMPAQAAEKLSYLAGNAAQVLYSRSCLIYMWGRRMK